MYYKVLKMTAVQRLSSLYCKDNGVFQTCYHQCIQCGVIFGCALPIGVIIHSITVGVVYATVQSPKWSLHSDIDISLGGYSELLMSVS